MLVGGLIGDVYTVVRLFDLIDVRRFVELLLDRMGGESLVLSLFCLPRGEASWNKARFVADVLAAAN